MLLSLAMFCSTGDVFVSVSGSAPVFIHINDCVYLYVSFLLSLLLFLCFSFGFWWGLFGNPGCPYPPPCVSVRSAVDMLSFKLPRDLQQLWWIVWNARCNCMLAGRLRWLAGLLAGLAALGRLRWLAGWAGCAGWLACLLAGLVALFALAGR